MCLGEVRHGTTGSSQAEAGASLAPWGRWRRQSGRTALGQCMMGTALGQCRWGYCSAQSALAPAHRHVLSPPLYLAAEMSPWPARPPARRQWVAEENRHGDLLNKYCFLSGKVNMRAGGISGTASLLSACALAPGSQGPAARSARGRLHPSRASCAAVGGRQLRRPLVMPAARPPGPCSHTPPPPPHLQSRSPSR